MKIYRCEICGNITVKIEDGQIRMNCCGQEMTELQAREADFTTEKHVPVIEKVGNNVNVTVGSTLHPMTEEHYIQFIILETKQGFKLNYLKPGQEPKTTFVLADNEEVVAVYEYCNLHGLWKNAL